jgi:Domain of unknown function (DUF4263)
MRRRIIAEGFELAGSADVSGDDRAAYTRRMSARKGPPTGGELNEALKRFGDLLGRDSRESAFQQLFADCPFIFSRTLPLRFEPSEVIPLGRPGRSEPDFVVFPSEGRPLGSYGIIEIKRPDTKLFVRPPRVGTLELAKDLRTAITQSRLYEERSVPRQLEYGNERVVMLGIRSEIFLISGLSRELAAALSSELYDGQLLEKLPHNCKLIPYDTLFESFRATVPPRLLSLRPGLPLVAADAVFSGLRSVTIQPKGHPSLKDFSCGRSARWELEVNMIVAGLYAGDRSDTVVRITESADGALVGVSASEPRALTEIRLDPPDSRHETNHLLRMVGLSEHFRGCRNRDGESLGDAILLDALSEISRTEDRIPTVLATVDPDNSLGMALASRHGFDSVTRGLEELVRLERPVPRIEALVRPADLPIGRTS